LNTVKILDLFDLIHGECHWIVLTVQGNLTDMRIIADERQCTSLGIGFSECLKKYVRKKTCSLPDAVQVRQQIPAVNDDSIFLHDATITKLRTIGKPNAVAFEVGPQPRWGC
jgi:hypothetical protein